MLKLPGMKRTLVPLVFAAAVSTALFAAPPKAPQNKPQPAATPDPTGATPAATPAPTNIALWRCSLPGGTYSVAVRAIVSVSQHEFTVAGGTARVTEANIDTMGNTVARFYYIEPMVPSSPIGLGTSTINKIQDIVNEAGSRVTGGDEPWKKVVKDYPTSTHAHTVEYRLDSKDQVTSVFTSAEAAFRLQKNTTYSPGGTSGGQ